MSIKTYVLLESLDSDAPIFQTTADGQRVQIKKMPVHRPTLRQTFQDSEGVTHTIRYKANSNHIDQKQQMELEKIEANVPFTTREYRDPEFKFGSLTTNKKILQDYLEAHPEFNEFNGTCDDIPTPRYKVYDIAAEAKLSNTEMRSRIKAGAKVLELDLEGAQAMLLRLNGSFFDVPKGEGALDVCQRMLIEFIDDAEMPGIEAVLKTDTDMSVDEQTTVLLGKLINQGAVSFDAVKGNISKKDKNNKWLSIREMADTYSIEERMRLFSDFLNSPDGKTLKNDLEKSLKK